MSSSENEEHQQSQSHCPGCRRKYVSVSEEEDQQMSKQKIVIPIREDREAQNSNMRFELMLSSLKAEMQTLRKQNIEKDKCIEDLRREIDHKMTHYMIYGEINKQADQISRLKSQIKDTKKCSAISFYGLPENEGREKRKKEKFEALQSKRTEGKRCYSTRDNYSHLRKQFFSPRYEKEYAYDTKNSKKEKNLLNLGEIKKNAKEMQQKIKQYQTEMKWMINFVGVFIKTIQKIALAKYQEQIVVPEWSLKKKAKICWRYLKHLFQYFYSQDINDC